MVKIMKLLSLIYDACKKLLHGNTIGLSMLSYSLAGGDKLLITEIHNSRGTLLDVGAYDGELALQVALLNPEREIISYEPVNNFYMNLSEKASNFPNWSTYCYGLGVETEDVEISLLGTSSSIVANISNQRSVIQIRDICEEIENKENLVLKLNIEGAEYALLEKLIERKFINKINTLIVQFHKIDGNSLQTKKKIIEQLSQTHVCKWSYNFVWEIWEIKS